MRLTVDDHAYIPPAVAAPPAPAAPVVAADPTAPEISFLATQTGVALQSFYATIERITADNPVPIARLQELAGNEPLPFLTPREVVGGR